MHTVALNPHPGKPLKKLRLAVVGAGALGSELCRHLMLRSVEQVTVIDPDMLAEHNLSMSRLFQQSQASQEPGAKVVGRSKAQLVVEQAALLGLRWRALVAEVADTGLGRFTDVDVILSCPDSALARAETCWTARALGLPMLDGGLQTASSDRETQAGRVTWFSARPDAACYLCGLTEARKAELLAYALSPSLGCAAPPDFVPMSGSPEISCRVAERMIAMLYEDLNNPQFEDSFAFLIKSAEPEERIELLPGAGCPWHNLPAPQSLFAIDEEASLADAVKDVCKGDEVLELAWSICMEARCGGCYRSCTPFARTARVRRMGCCPHCGRTGRLEPLRTVTTVHRSDPCAALSARQLGLPADGRYTKRRRLRWPGAATG